MLKRFICFFFLLSSFLCCHNYTQAQGLTGNDFWFTMPDNASRFLVDNFVSDGLEELNNGENVIYVVSQYCIDSAYAIIGAYDDTIYFSVEPGNFTAVRIPFFKDDKVSFPVVDSTVAHPAQQDIVDFFKDLNTPVRKAVHIVSPDPISIFFLSYQRATADAETIIPTQLLGTEYVINTRASTGGRSNPCEPFPTNLKTQGYVIATEDNTDIEINTWDRNGVPITYTDVLDAGEVYSWHGERTCDDDLELTLGCGSLSGSTINASKPVSVMSSSTCAFIGAALACDALVAQHLPISELGTEYVTVQVQERNYLDFFDDCNTFNTSSGDFVEITGRIGETVEITSKLGVENIVIPVPSGVTNDYGWGTIFKELPEDVTNSGFADMVIKGEGPLLVNQYSKGTTVDGISSADPEQLTVFPHAMWESSYFFYPVRTPTSQALEVVIVVEDIGTPAPISTIEVNDVNVGAGGWSQIPNTAYKYKRLSYTQFEASKVLSTTGNNFGLFFFARGNAESALFSGGYGPIQDLNLCDQCGEIDITIDGSTCLGQEIAFEPRIYSFTRPNTLNFTWNFGDGAVSNQQFPTHTYATEGKYTVTLQVSGTEGCILEADKVVYVNSVGLNPEPLPDTICIGDIAQVTPNYQLIPGGDQVVQYRNNENGPITIPDNGVSSFWDGTTFGGSNFASSSVTVNNFYNTPGSIDSICINLDHELISDINIYLEIPGGIIYELLTNPVSNGRTNLRKTCFTANALELITDAFPPYTGAYLTEGGDYPPARTSPQINGDYILRVGDERINFTGEIVDWSLYISSEIGVASIDWTPNIAPLLFDQEDITGNAKARPNVTTRYYVEVSDYSGCGNTDSLDLEVQRLPVELDSRDTLVCNVEEQFLLLDLITDPIAQLNGTWEWTPPVGVDPARLNGNVFDTRELIGGNYRFKYTEDVFCGQDSAIVVVSVNELPFLGSDSTDILCDTETALSLFPYLDGADAGGVWESAPVLSTNQFNAGILDPTLLPQGDFSFFYSKPIEACPVFTSRVDIRVNHQPNAGQNGDTIICESGTPLLLTSVLNGTIEGGGVWSDVDASGGLISGNLFNSFDAPQNPNSQFFRFDYTIMGAEACKDSTARATVNVIAAPEINLSANFPILCRDSTVVIDAVLEGNGPFDLEITDALGNTYPPANELPIGNAYSFDQPLAQTSTFEVTRLIDNSSLRCPIVKPQSITVEVYDPIIARLVSEDCILNPDGITFLGFTPVIELAGGSGDYSYDLFIDGVLTKTNVSAPNAVHNLDTLPNGVEYSYRFYDGSNCPDVEAEFFRRPRKYCECATFAGFMDNETVEVCEYETAIVPVIRDSILEPEDTVYYILHDRAGIILGERLDSNATPEFTYFPGLAYNRTYFISAIAGDSLNGGISPTDTCVSVADGTPVIFRPQPNIAFANNGGAICEGDIYNLDITLTGNGPFTLYGNAINAQGITPLVLNNLDSNTIALNPLENTVYEFTRIEDANTNTCFRVLNERITIDVFQLPRVRITNPDTVAICEGSIASIDLSITGGTGPYRIEILKDGAPFGQPIQTSNNTVSFSVAQAGLYKISDIQDEGANCSGLVLDGSVYVVVKKQPVANAGVSPIEPCGNFANLNAQPTFGIGRWQQPTSGYTFSNARSAKTIGFVPSPGDYTFIWEEENAPCPVSRDTVFATFYEQPTANAGPDSLFCSTVATLYAKPSTGSNGSGFWIYNGTGDVTFTNPTSPNSPVIVGNSGTYELVWREQVDNRCVDFDTVAVTFSDFLRASVIDTICLNDGANYQFVFNVVGGDPNTLTVNGELIGDLPYTSPVLNSGQAYKFGFSDLSTCGYSDTVRTTYGCPCTSDAGTLVQDTIKACLGDVVSVQRLTDLVRDPDDTTIYVLHTRSDDTLGGIILSKGSNDLRLTGNLTPGKVYYLSRVVGSRTAANPGVDLTEYCLSVAPGVPVLVGRPAQALMLVTNRVCQGEDVLLSVGGNGTGPYQFELRQGINGTPVTVNLAVGDDFVLSNLTPGNYTYYISNFQDEGNNPCTKLQTNRVEFSVAPNPQAQVTMPSLGCVNKNIVFEAVPQENIRISWDFGDGSTVVTGNTRSHTYTTSGTYTVTTTVFNTVTNCFTEQPQDIVIQDFPVLNARINDLPDLQRKVCIGDDIVVQNVAPEPGVTYQWIVNGTPRVPYTPIFTLNDLSTSTTIVLEGVTSAGCKSTLTFNVGLIIPSAQLDIPRVTCNKDDLLLRFTNPENVTNFEWKVTGASTTSYFDNPAMVSVNEPSAPFALDINLVLTSKEGCVDSIQQSITLESVLADFRINPIDGELCPGDTLRIVSNDSWSSGLDTNTVLFRLGDGRLSSSRGIVTTYGTPGTYRITQEVRNSRSQCTDTFFKDITVVTPPQVTNNTIDACVTDFEVVLDASIPDGSSYTWSPNNLLDTIAPSLGPVVSYFPNTERSLPYTATFDIAIEDINGCTGISTFKVNIRGIDSIPEFPANNDTLLVQGDSLLFNLPVIDGLRYFWEPEEDFVCPACPEQKLIAIEPTEYTLNITDIYGCIDEKRSFNIEVEINKYSLDVPDAFTPNGDGINDEIYPQGWGVETYEYFRVYNRFGQLVFEGSGTNPRWDGMYEGKPAQTGDYVFQVSAKRFNQRIRATLSGTFELIR